MKTTKLTKEQMMNNAMRRFGLENEWVIAFCSACENGIYSDSILEILYNCKMKNADEGIDDEGEI